MNDNDDQTLQCPECKTNSLVVPIMSVSLLAGFEWQSEFWRELGIFVDAWMYWNCQSCNCVINFPRSWITI